jgi:hypothetical protein
MSNRSYYIADSGSNGYFCPDENTISARAFPSTSHHNQRKSIKTINDVRNDATNKSTSVKQWIIATAKTPQDVGDKLNVKPSRSSDLPKKAGLALKKVAGKENTKSTKSSGQCRGLQKVTQPSLQTSPLPRKRRRHVLKPVNISTKRRRSIISISSDEDEGMESTGTYGLRDVSSGFRTASVIDISSDSEGDIEVRSSEQALEGRQRVTSLPLDENVRRWKHGKRRGKSLQVISRTKPHSNDHHIPRKQKSLSRRRTNSSASDLRAAFNHVPLYDSEVNVPHSTSKSPGDTATEPIVLEAVKPVAKNTAPPPTSANPSKPLSSTLSQVNPDGSPSKAN